MKRLGIMANCSKPRAADVLRRVAEESARFGIKLHADPATARVLGACESVPVPALFDCVDAVVALGGDGTMLRVARAVGSRNTPIMGLNIGSLGFLTSVAEDELAQAFQCLAADQFTMSSRTMALCVVEREGRELFRDDALNDVVVGRRKSSRIITLDVAIDSRPVTSYTCDGLIISTPTGSTGHSLSAGGPIMLPETPVFVLSLVCPHTLSSRPVVVPDQSEIEVIARESTVELMLTVDGQVEQPLASGDLIRVRKSGRCARFIHLPGYSYFSVLRQKLHWSGSNV
jgi:NAD+ kinase